MGSKTDTLKTKRADGVVIKHVRLREKITVLKLGRSV